MHRWMFEARTSGGVEHLIPGLITPPSGGTDESSVLGDHVQAAFDAVRAEGLEVEVGPFGSSVTGPAEQVSRAIGRLVADATEAGATRISFQVTLVES